MYDYNLLSVFTDWRHILHVTEWTTVGIGVLAGCIVLGFKVPLFRHFAVNAALCAGIAYLCLMHGDATGRADQAAKCAAARDAAAKAASQRDQDINATLEKSYGPALSALRALDAKDKERADAAEQKLKTVAAQKPATRSHCVLGAAARRVPVGK